MQGWNETVKGIKLIACIYKTVLSKTKEGKANRTKNERKLEESNKNMKK